MTVAVNTARLTDLVPEEVIFVKVVLATPTRDYLFRLIEMKWTNLDVVSTSSWAEVLDLLKKEQAS